MLFWKEIYLFWRVTFSSKISHSVNLKWQPSTLVLKQLNFHEKIRHISKFLQNIKIMFYLAKETTRKHFKKWLKISVQIIQKLIFNPFYKRIYVNLFAFSFSYKTCFDDIDSEKKNKKDCEKRKVSLHNYTFFCQSFCKDIKCLFQKECREHRLMWFEFIPHKIGGEFQIERIKQYSRE